MTSDAGASAPAVAPEARKPNLERNADPPGDAPANLSLIPALRYRAD